MQIFIDSANIAEIEKWLEMGVIDGVTTNPSVMLKDGVYNAEEKVREIASLVHLRPVSVEVTTDGLDEILIQARSLSSWAPNIVVKIPQVTRDGTPCYGVMRQLESEGIKVNATVALSLGQVILSTKAGVTYASMLGPLSAAGRDNRI